MMEPRERRLSGGIVPGLGASERSVSGLIGNGKRLELPVSLSVAASVCGVSYAPDCTN